jgi:hypothetical protein
VASGGEKWNYGGSGGYTTVYNLTFVLSCNFANHKSDLSPNQTQVDLSFLKDTTGRSCLRLRPQYLPNKVPEKLTELQYRVRPWGGVVGIPPAAPTPLTCHAHYCKSVKLANFVRKLLVNIVNGVPSKSSLPRWALNMTATQTQT